MQKWLSSAALCVSIIAVALSAWSIWQAEARADRAVLRREKALVSKCKPAFDQMYKDFELKPQKEPTTLDELFQNYFELFGASSINGESAGREMNRP